MKASEAIIMDEVNNLKGVIEHIHSFAFVLNIDVKDDISTSGPLVAELP